MKKTIILLCMLLTPLSFAQIERPKLVVGIVVDQMRPDYLYRYYNDFGENGFKRLMKEGFVFKNTNYNYMPTYTAPGHSSIYTGTTPAVHGIVGNHWFHRREHASVYCTYDNNVQAIGVEKDNKEGKMSPTRLKASTVTDELRLDTNFRGKVIGISVKDRGAILPAGHFANAAYWMAKNGHFISSSFYMKDLPQWVKTFNDKKLAEQYIQKGWKLLKHISAYDESTEDNTPYEKILKTKETPTFPYDLKKIAAAEGSNEIIKSTPYGNDIVAEFAKTAIQNENLGKDSFTDFLAVSFSSTDYVGHAFAPRSIEIQDTYLRLDKTLADFLKYLDKTIGKGAYLLFLTADHAAAENALYLKDRGYATKVLDYKEVFKQMQSHFEKIYGFSVIEDYSNQNIFLNEAAIKQKKIEYEEVVRAVKNWMEEQPYVARVYSKEDILRGNPVDYNLSLIQRGYDPKQNGDLIVLYDPQVMEYMKVGTSHGSTYMYDTHVPNIWFGWKIKPGKSYKRYDITNIAPTISQKLNIPMPNGTQGNLLLEVLE